MRTFKICSLGVSQIYNMALLTLVVLYFTSPELIYLIPGILCLFDQLPLIPHPHPPTSGSRGFDLFCFCVCVCHVVLCCFVSFWIPHRSKIIWYSSFCLTSLTARSFHVAPNKKIPVILQLHQDFISWRQPLPQTP